MLQSGRSRFGAESGHGELWGCIMRHLLCCSADWEQVQRAFGLWGCAVCMDGEVSFSLSLTFFFLIAYISVSIQRFYGDLLCLLGKA